MSSSTSVICKVREGQAGDGVGGEGGGVEKGESAYYRRLIVYKSV